jgi:hypothetical protein
LLEVLKIRLVDGIMTLENLLHSKYHGTPVLEIMKKHPDDPKAPRSEFENDSGVELNMLYTK